MKKRLYLFYGCYFLNTCLKFLFAFAFVAVIIISFKFETVCSSRLEVFCKVLSCGFANRLRFFLGGWRRGVLFRLWNFVVVILVKVISYTFLFVRLFVSFFLFDYPSFIGLVLPGMYSQDCCFI